MRYNLLALFNIVVSVFYSTSTYCQTTQMPSRSDTRNVIWKYSLPANSANGPLDVSASFEYYFWRENIGDKSYLGLTMKTTDLSYITGPGGYRFTYQGKTYNSGQLGDGNAGFTDIKITSISLTINVQGGVFGDIAYNSSFTSHTRIAEISKTVDLNNFSLDWPRSYARNFNYENSWGIIDKINAAARAAKNKSLYEDNIRNGDRAFNSGNLSEAKSNYQKAAQLMPEESYPNQQLQKIKQQEEKQAEANKAASSSNSGSGYGTGSNSYGGSATSNTYSSGAGSNSAKSSYGNSNYTGNTSSGNSYSGSSNSYSGSQNGPITNMSDKVKSNGVDVQVYQQNGKNYMLKADGTRNEISAETYNRIQNISTTNATNKANYEKALQDQQAQTAINRAEYERKLANPFGGDATYQAVSQGMQIAGDFMNYIGEEMRRENELRAQREESQRIAEAQRRQEEYEKQKAEKIMLDSRKDVLKIAPAGKTPLSSEATDNSAVHFFVYSCDETKLKDANVPLHISNVFCIEKYSDGTWPFKDNIMQHIAKYTNGLPVKLSGYFLSKEEAELLRGTMLDQAGDNGFTINKITVADKKVSNGGSAITDFWGRPLTPAATTTGSETTTPVKETRKPAYDFWGNPIKTETPATEPSTIPAVQQKKTDEDFWSKP